MARNRIRNWTAVAILFFSLVAIVITGFGTGGIGGLDSLRGGGGGQQNGELARVGSRVITATEANDQLNQTFSQIRRQVPSLQMAEFLAQGGLEGAVDQLVAIEALRQFAAARGIVVTKQMVDRSILSSPEFQFARIGDRFDNGIFQRALQEAGYTEERIRDEFSRQLLQQQVLVPIQSGFTIPAGVARAYAAVPFEQRTGFIGAVPLAAVERGINPSDAELARFYQNYSDRFTVPERRVLRYALIGPEQISITPPTEAEINAVYAHTPRYQAGQIRTLLSITFPANAQAQANAFAQQVRGGTPFMTAATAAGRTEADVRVPDTDQRGFANRTSADVAAQSFRAPQGTVLGPIRSPLGWHVVRVETASPGQPLASVRADIVRELERRKRSAAVLAATTQIEQQLTDGASIEDAAAAAHLTLVATPPLTAQGREANGRTPGTPVPDQILAAAFDQDPDHPQAVTVPIEENLRYGLVILDRVEQAAPPPLAQIRDRVRAVLIRVLARQRTRQIADGIAARINGGMAPVQAFAQAGIPLPPPAPISARRQDIMGQQAAPPSLGLFFRLRPGTAALIAAPGDNGWMIAAPMQSLRAGDQPAQAVVAIQRELTQAGQLEMERQLLRAVELRSNVQRNAAAIASERARISATAAPAAQQ